MEKEKYDKAHRLTILNQKLRDHTIGFSGLLEVKKLAGEVSNYMSEKDIEDFCIKLGFLTNDDLLNKLGGYDGLDYANKMKISEFVGTISGITMKHQMDVIKEHRKENNEEKTEIRKEITFDDFKRIKKLYETLLNTDSDKKCLELVESDINDFSMNKHKRVINHYVNFIRYLLLNHIIDKVDKDKNMIFSEIRVILENKFNKQ